MTNKEAIDFFLNQMSFPRVSTPWEAEHNIAIEVGVEAIKKIDKIEQIIQAYYDNIDICGEMDEAYAVIDKIEKVLQE